jgi:hypothetical protein
METASAEVRTLPVGRAFFADEQGTFLRTTWHLDRGFVNLSVWRDAVCIVTFHLPVEDSARLATFLIEGLGEATTALLQSRAAPAVVPPPPDGLRPAPPTTASDVVGQLTEAARSARRCLADWIRPSGDAAS